MPYISQDERAQLDELIDSLSTRIKLMPNESRVTREGFPLETLVGRLNYVCTRLALNLIGEVKYWKIAILCGVFSNVASEFYRKLATPYEDKKIAENGDVYPVV